MDTISVSAEEIAAMRTADHWQPLPKSRTAENTLTFPQIAMFIVVAGVIVATARLGWNGFWLTINCVICGLYLTMLAVKGLFIALSVKPVDNSALLADVAALTNADCPMYTIGIPMHDEKAATVRSLVSRLLVMDYPKDRMDVIFAVEATDYEAIETLQTIRMPEHWRTLVLAKTRPQTKPKALNVILAHARGDYFVIYDAEDRPDRDQLKKALAQFAKSPERVVCLQARLTYYNPHTNLQTRWFTGEYASHFRNILVGMVRMKAPIPLGGTSNHFKTPFLREIGGWDPFNVTEDADLGIRIARGGFTTAILDSDTYEEANSKVGNWVRQRSRWIKGYLQTWLVHFRNPFKLFHELGPVGFFAFLFFVPATPFMLLINPIMWIQTIVYVIASFMGATGVTHAIESFYPGPLFYIAVFCLVAGNFLFMLYTIGSMIAYGPPGNAKWMLGIPFYWALMSVAAWKALYQMVVRPHYWEKTKHGFVLDEISHDQLAKLHEAIPESTAEVRSEPLVEPVE